VGGADAAYSIENSTATEESSAQRSLALPSETYDSCPVYQEGVRAYLPSLSRPFPSSWSLPIGSSLSGLEGLMFQQDIKQTGATTAQYVLSETDNPFSESDGGQRRQW
jgi:hypothetical protein